MENSKVIISLEHQFGFVQLSSGQMQQQLDEFCDLFLNKD